MEGALPLQKGGRMQDTALNPAPRRHHVMEHLVIDDVSNEIPRDPGSVEDRVDPDEALGAAVAS
jgi:hypothetical protein